VNLKKYIAELKKRHVIKAGLAYLVAAWVLSEVAALVLDSFEAPSNFMKGILIILAIGFPIWLIFSWVYDITSEGIKKTGKTEHPKSETLRIDKRVNRVIISLLSIAIIILVVNQFRDSPDHISEMEDSNELIDSNHVKVKSIAVLAFSDLSPDQDQEYFSDGISEELLNLLTKIPDLKVISRTSSFSYKGKDHTIEQIGEELNVSHILEGSVRKSGNKIRITAQLINVADGSHIWSETYDRNMEDVFRIQDEIAQMVTRQLKITLLGDMAKATEVNPDAYTLYLQANHLLLQHNVEAVKKAEDIIKQSLAIDSLYAPSWNLFSKIVLTSASNFYQKPYKEGLESSEHAVLKSLELDKNYAPAYAQLADIQSMYRDFELASENIDKALLLDGGNVSVIRTAAKIASNAGRLDKHEEFLLQAIALDPLDYSNYYRLGIVYMWSYRWDDAYEALKRYSYFRPDAALQHAMIAFTLLGQGKDLEALKEVEKEPSEFWNLYIKIFVINSMGNQEQADSLMAKFTGSYSDSNPVMLATLYANRGEIDVAFKWLEIAYEEQDPDLTEAINYTDFATLYKDPRWDAFLDKLSLPKDHWLLNRAN